MNQFVFNNDTPLCTGTWYSTKINDHFTVKDCFFENNEYIIMTTDGRRFDFNTLERGGYVQSDKPITPIKENANVIESIPDEVASLLLPEDANMFESTTTLNTPISSAPQAAPQVVNTPSVLDEDDMLVRRILKRASSPNITTSIKWTKYPVKQMEMLIDMMGIDIEKIADFYIQQIDLQDIKEKLAKDIARYIENSSTQGIESEPCVVEKEEVKEKVKEEVKKVYPLKKKNAKK